MKHTIKSTTVGAFSLIELLVVMAVIAILAGMLLTTGGAASRDKARARLKASVNELVTVIDEYHASRGVYPFTGTKPTSIDRPTLYYELVGTSFDKASSTYTTLDGRQKISLNDVKNFFQTEGFANSGLKSEDAKNFYVNVGKDSYADHPDAPSADQGLGVLIAPVKSFDGRTFMVWKYNSRNPTNNPGRYDLWVEWQSDKGKTEIIGNF